MGNVQSKGAVHNCTGCGMCSAVCPHNAVSIIENKVGFYRPVIDEIKCIDCGLCQSICYKFDHSFSIKEHEEYECYSAVNKDEKELNNASSGAVSIELMRECLKRGYYVLGVAYDTETERAVTRIAKTESELDQFKGSKYFQSNTTDAFSEIFADKSEQKYAVFGTPCQIYGFARMAEVQKNRDRFIFVDIFCHGCPSLKLWDKYLDYVKTEHQLDRLDSITFRSKSHGWHEYCFDFFREKQKITSSKYQDSFYELFFSGDLFNEACYNCIARSTVEKTDIRIGDFWGKRYNHDVKGVSAVVISTERGQDLFSGISSKLNIARADFQEIIRVQSYKKIHHHNIDRRNKLLALLCGTDDINMVLKTYRRMAGLKVNVKRVVKCILKHLPASVYVKLKVKFGQ